MKKSKLCLMSIGCTLAMCSIAACTQEQAPPTNEYQYDETLSSLIFTGFFVYDAGSECAIKGTTVRCCPPSTAIIGVKYLSPFPAVVLKCAQLASPGSRDDDHGTVRNRMMACPVGSLIVGFNPHEHLRLCEALNPAPTFEFVDGIPPTMDSYPMHVCPANFALSGLTLQVDNDLFTCAL